MNIELVDITAARIEETVEMINAAFRNDPVMCYFVGDDGASDKDLMKRVVALSVLPRLQAGFPLRAAVVDNEIVGATCTSPVFAGTDHSIVSAVTAELRRELPVGVNRRIEAYEAATKKFEVKTPHYYVGVLAVRPDRQGHGLGGRLLREIHEWSRQHPHSEGVALDTENPVNVPMYQHLGYEVTGEEHIDGVDVWVLYRKDR
jgi:GNAT superfamily N-acetyltransferase